MQIIRKNTNWASPLFKRNKTNRIILHHAQAKTCSVEDIHQWHLKKGWSGIGYHFLVRKDGTIYQGRLKIQSGRMLKVQIMIQSVFVLKEIS